MTIIHPANGPIYQLLTLAFFKHYFGRRLSTCWQLNQHSTTPLDIFCYFQSLQASSQSIGFKTFYPNVQHRQSSIMHIQALITAFVLALSTSSLAHPTSPSDIESDIEARAPSASCRKNCRCLGTRTVDQLYCGYCEDVWPIKGGGVLHGNEMFTCQPGGGCCNHGFNQTCQDVYSQEWCGHGV